MITPNPEFINCINHIKNWPIALQKLNIIYDKPIKFKKHKSVFYYEPDIKKFDHIAAFDLDWTLTYNEQSLIPKEVDDIKIFPNRRKKLEDIIKLGYNIVIFTNQYAKSENEKQKKVKRITTFIKELKLPVFVYISTEKDDFRVLITSSSGETYTYFVDLTDMTISHMNSSGNYILNYEADTNAVEYLLSNDPDIYLRCGLSPNIIHVSRVITPIHTFVLRKF